MTVLKGKTQDSGQPVHELDMYVFAAHLVLMSTVGIFKRYFGA